MEAMLFIGRNKMTKRMSKKESSQITVGVKENHLIVCWLLEKFGEGGQLSEPIAKMAKTATAAMKVAVDENNAKEHTVKMEYFIVSDSRIRTNCADYNIRMFRASGGPAGTKRVLTVVQEQVEDNSEDIADLKLRVGILEDMLIADGTAVDDEEEDG
jgi:hypothetical protein